MYIINEMAKLANTVLGEQQIKYETKYRKLAFVRILRISDSIVAYNNLTKELVLLNNAEASVIESDEILPNEDISELIKRWFLVPLNAEDIKICEQLLEVAKLFNKKDYINNFIILTTTDCNARCFYCYEAGTKKVNMDEKTALDVANYIKRVSKNKPVVIRWFGGEPLYNYKAIDIICEQLKKYGISYTSMIVTNALLFNSDLISKARELWHLTFAQITLDGTEAIYNRTKNYIDCKSSNPFETVLTNINELINNEVTVKIRLNMDKHNSNDLFKLIDLLDDRFPERSHLKIYAHLLFEDFGFHKIKHQEEEKEALNNEFLRLNEYISKKNFSSNSLLKNNIRVNCCMADDDTFTLISPLGYLGKCEHYVGEHFYGHINSDNLDINEIKRWKNRRPIINECKNCVCYPTCFYLEACNTHQNQCSEFERKCEIQKLDKKIKNSYIKLTRGDGDNTDDGSLC